VFWISPVWISNPLRQMLMSSHPETDCHGYIGGGSLSESDKCIAHATASASAYPDRPASCVYGVCSQLGWYMGVNPGTCLVCNDSGWDTWGVARKGCGCVCCELLASFLALLLVILPDTELLQAFSCGTRGKVSAGELYK